MKPAYAAVFEHPFLTGLVDGSLPTGCFTYYVAQDAHYLRDYGRALAALAGRAPSGLDAAMLARHAVGTAEVELSLHQGLLAEVGLDAAALAAMPVGPTTHAYTRHLLGAVHGGSFAEGLAAVVPCYWIYARVGQALVGRGSSEPRYQRWIETYAGEEFAGVVVEVLDLVDRIGTGLTHDQRAAAHVEAERSARYEWMFWDAALRQERWPV
ncbi:thiaminase II [Nocardioides korecus]